MALSIARPALKGPALHTRIGHHLSRLRTARITAQRQVHHPLHLVLVLITALRAPYGRARLTLIEHLR